MPANHATGRSKMTPVQAGTRVRVLLADDFEPFRENLIASLPLSGKLELAGQARNGVEAVDLARTLAPDLIVMDYRMPELDGVAATLRILEENPSAAILISSLSFERPYVMRALTAGARGYLAKDDALDSLPDALNAVLAGRTFVSRSVAALLARTAPANPLALTQQVLWTFDREAPALLQCARAVTRGPADEAVLSAFRAFWMTLREGQAIPDPQTWLLVSLAARLFPAAGKPTSWSLSRPHPSDRDLKRRDERLAIHVASCRTCFLAWTLAAHDPADATDTEALREMLIHDLEVPDEAALFTEFAVRQGGVMRMAAAELQLLLGSGARRGWMRREASAGRWLGALLGGQAA